MKFSARVFMVRYGASIVYHQRHHRWCSSINAQRPGVPMPLSGSDNDMSQEPKESSRKRTLPCPSKVVKDWDSPYRNQGGGEEEEEEYHYLAKRTELKRQNPYLLVRSCHLVDSTANDRLLVGDREFCTRTFHTGMHIAFLGTAGGQSTTLRNAPSTALQFGGKTFLFDVGEGIQRQLQSSTLTSSEITKIFITHMHGDHVFGLPSLLLELSVQRKKYLAQQQQKLTAASKRIDHHRDKFSTIEIYGPPGLYNYICMNLVLTYSKFNTLHVIVHELIGGKGELRPNHQSRKGQGTTRVKNPFTEHYSEFADGLPSVERRCIPMHPDGTWTIEQPDTVTEELIWNRYELIQRKINGTYAGIIPRLPNDYRAGPGKRLRIKASQVLHMPGIPTFGYVVEEMPPPAKIDPNKAVTLGLAPGPKYDLLKNGFSVMDDDGKIIVYPHQVVMDNQTLQARKFVFLGDNYHVPPPMANLCQDADVIVHEATFLATQKQTHGHSTAEMAGKFAYQVNAKALVLNHFGATIFGEQTLDLVISQARKGNKDTSHIIASKDFMEVIVPVSRCS